MSDRYDTTLSKPERHHDLDWLRVLAILLLHFFHSGMAYVKWDWHIKNDVFSSALEEIMFHLHQWRMPLLFLISGAGTRFALGFRSGGQYARERLQRLLVPVVFGMLVIVPPQVYFERLQQGRNFASFWQFYPHFFDGIYPRGNFSWRHLWFIVYLLAYSLLALPLLLHLRSEVGQKHASKMAALFDRPGAIILCGIPLAVIQASLRGRWPATHDLIHDWANHAFYFVFFFYGYLICSDAGFWRVLRQRRRFSLQLACLTVLLLMIVRWNGHEPRRDDSTPYALFMALLGFNTWFWVATVIGYGRHYLSFNSRFLQYANEGIYPFYILHQTLIVAVAFYVVQTKDDLWLKYLFTLAVSFAGTVAIYEFLIRPFRVPRFLFGMKPKKLPEPDGH